MEVPCRWEGVYVLPIRSDSSSPFRGATPTSSPISVDLLQAWTRPRTGSWHPMGESNSRFLTENQASLPLDQSGMRGSVTSPVAEVVSLLLPDWIWSSQEDPSPTSKSGVNAFATTYF